MTTGLLGTVITDEDIGVIRPFADQLALVLDAAQLLARAVAVERSLAHAEKLAAIGELVARIAHEIRNPVTAARSLAQQLAHEAPAPLGEPARLVLEELGRVERQVADLLRFARRDDFRLEPVDLGSLARDTVATLRPRLDAARVELELVDGDGAVARADREKLRQVLVNLVENAIAAREGAAMGARRLRIAVARTDDRATLEVADNGPGVPPDALPRLFEPFFSLKPDGTGLGLAIARRTIEAHGGVIEARSPGGGGMTVRLELPLATDEDRPA